MPTVLFDHLSLVTHSTLFTIFAVLLCIVYSDTRGVRVFAVGSTLLQLGLALFLLAPSNQYFWHVIIPANLLLLWGGMLQLFGLALFFNSPLKLKQTITIVFVSSLIFLYFVLLSPSYSGRVIAINLCLGYIYLRALALIIKTNSKTYKVSKIFLTPSLSVIVVILASRTLNEIIPNGLWGILVVNQFLAETIFIFVLCMLFGFFILSAEAQVASYKRISQLYEEKSNSKSKIIEFLSHEFKTPLNAIMIKLELMLHKYNSTPLVNDVRFIQKVNSQLLSITKEMLESEKLDKNSDNMNQRVTFVNVREWLTSMVIDHQEVAVSKSLDFRLTINDAVPKQAMIHTSALRPVLSNLLSNAVKYTNQGFVELSVNAVSAGNFIEFTIIDSGIGIPKEQLQKVQKTYQRATNVEDYEGNGIGLNIVSQLLKDLKSSLHISTKLGEGTTVNFRVPLKPIG